MFIGGAMFIGIGVGLLVDHVAAGTVIGIGVGLILMPFENYIRSKLYKTR